MIVDPIRTIVDFSFYKEASRHSPIRCVGYVVYVCLLLAIVGAVLIYSRMRPAVLGAGEWMATSLPAITIDGGKATSDPPGPVLLHPPKEDRLGIFIDTSRTQPFTIDEMTAKSLSVAVTRDAIFVAFPDRGQLEARPFSEMKLDKPLTVDAAFYRRAARMTMDAVYGFVLPMCWVMLIFWKLASAAIYSMMGLVISESTQKSLPFPTIYKLSIYAQTPWIVLQAVMLPVRRGLPFGATILLGFAVTGVYLWKAISLADAPAPPPPVPAA